MTLWLSHAPGQCYHTYSFFCMLAHDAHRSCVALSLLTSDSGGQLSADSIVELNGRRPSPPGPWPEPKNKVSTVLRRVQTAHDQCAQAGTDARVCGSVPVQKEAKPHRKCASL